MKIGWIGGVFFMLKCDVAPKFAAALSTKLELEFSLLENFHILAIPKF